MAKRILLCGEGPTDYGNPKYGSHDWEEGPVQPIIRKSVNGDIEFAYTTKEDIKFRLFISRCKSYLITYYLN